MPFRPALRAFLEVPLLHRCAPYLLVLAGAIVTVSFIWGIKQRIDDGHRDGLKTGLQTAQFAADAAHELVRARLRSIAQLAYLLEHVSAKDPEQASGVFTDRASLGLPGVTLLWANLNGSVIHASDPHAVGRQVPADWLEHAAKDGRVQLEERAPATTLLPTGVPLVKSATVGTTSGILVAIFPDAQFVTAVKKVLGKYDGYVALLNSHGEVVAASQGHGDVQGSTFGLMQRSLFARQGLDVLLSEPIDYLAAENTDPQTGVTVVTALKANEALSDWQQRKAKTLWMSLAMGGVVCVLIFGAAWTLRRSARVEGKLRSLVALDHLTQLPNRRTFTELLEDELQRAVRGKQLLGLMFIDLDNFKYVNDSLGHDVGDQLLVQVGQRLMRSVRTSDVVCRIGGDEFTVVLPKLASARDAELVAQRILEALAAPMHFGDKTLSVRASIGLALTPTDAVQTSQLVQCADMAVYKAKGQGKGCYARFEPKLLEASLARAELTQDLREALERNELHLVYQPKVCMSTGAVNSFEALLRWEHPRRGMVPPSEFIAVAEESDLILDIGDFVVQQAVRQLRVWNDEGHGWLSVAINVSARQLRHGHIAKTLRRTLVAHRVPAQYVQIELTETMLASNIEQASLTLAQLKALGVQVAVDDFGTGYSSLSALQQLDVDCIKVDRSFVANIETSHESAEICRAVVQLAHSMNLRVVAEGIETVAQYQYLVELGCNEGQGYYFAKPLPAEEAIAYGPSITLFAPR